jgi:hypothetical protein
MLGFLLSQTTQLNLKNCHLCSEQSFAAFLALDETVALSQNLTSVRMHDFRPCRSVGDVARRHWSGILNSLSDSTGLRYFMTEGLHHDSDWDLFHLPRTTGKYELSGEDVAEQLETMAGIVATALVTETSQLDDNSSEETSSTASTE